MSELPAVPKGWTWTNLGDFAEVKLGKMLSPKARAENLEQRPYLRNQNVRWGTLELSDVKTMGFKPSEIERYSVQPNDLLVCEGGEPARCAIYHGPPATFMYQKALHRVRPHHGIADPKYLGYCLWHYASNGVVLPRPSETTIQHLPLEEMQALPIPLPPLPEQHRIVEALETHFTMLDAVVGTLERVRSNLERYRAAVLHAAVEGRLGDGVDSARWDRVTMNELLVDIEAGRSFRCVERPPEGDEVGIVKVSAVTWGEFDSRESKTCIESNLVRPEFFIVPGDFLFSRANTIELVGACVIARNVRSKLMLSDKILRFRLLDGLDRWLLLVLRSRYGRSEIERLATGNQESMRNIGQERIRQIRVPLPSADERDRIIAAAESRLEAATHVDVTVARALRLLAQLRQSFLRSAFDGRLVPQDPRDEPASVLLDRIRAERAAAPPSPKKKFARSHR